MTNETENVNFLASVMTAGEAVEEFGLSEAAVRIACQRGSIPARKSGGTWLILRADAEKRWSDRRIASNRNSTKSSRKQSRKGISTKV